jgi:septum site-determining protein MinC
MIQLKGNGGRLRCVIPDQIPDGELSQEVRRLAEEGEHILRGSELVVDFESRRVTLDLMCLIMRELVIPLELKVVAWKSIHRESLELLKSAGLPVEEVPARSRWEGLLPALRVRRSLRSGQRVEHRGDVIVEGNVNDGAEVVAEGHVVVLGRLQGLVHAGSGGDEEATVCARAFEAPQVRIGFKVGSMGREDPWWGKAVTVAVEDGAVVVSQWPSA